MTKHLVSCTYPKFDICEYQFQTSDWHTQISYFMMTGCPSPGTRDSNNSSTLETLHLKALSLLLTTAFTVCDMGTAGTMYHHSLGRASDRETQCTSHLAHSQSYPACRVVVMLYRTGPALVRDRGGREKTQVQTSYYIPTDPQYPYLSGV